MNFDNEICNIEDENGGNSNETVARNSEDTGQDKSENEVPSSLTNPKIELSSPNGTTSKDVVDNLNSNDLNLFA